MVAVSPAIDIKVKSFTVTVMRRQLLIAATVPALLIAGCTSTPQHKHAPTPATALGSAYTTWQAGRSTPVAEPTYPAVGTATLDVLHYGLTLGWAPTTRILTGTATEQIRPTGSAPAFSLDFSKYTLDGVTVDGKTATAAIAGNKLRVSAAITKDRPFTLVVRYHGTPKPTPDPSHRSDAAGLGLTVNKVGDLSTMQEPYGAFTWYPCNDMPSDKALYDVAVTVPRGWSAIASGTPSGRTGDTFSYRSAAPMASYLMTLAAGKYTKLTATGPGGIPMTFWYRKGTKDARFVPVLKDAPNLLAWLEKRLGPLPFPSLGAVMVDSPSAMETQQMVTMGNGTFGHTTWTDPHGRLLHEFAHQWFGDTVTTSTWQDLWLNESPTTLVQLLWQQSLNHDSDAVLTKELESWTSWARMKYGPAGQVKATDFGEDNSYFPLAQTLREMYLSMGDTAFFTLMRAWVHDHEYTSQDRSSFIAFVNKQTGKNDTSMFTTALDTH